MGMITAQLTTYPWVYTTHKGMEMITAELTTYPWVYTTHKAMEMITAELTPYPWVYTTHKGMEMITAELTTYPWVSPVPELPVCSCSGTPCMKWCMNITVCFAVPGKLHQNYALPLPSEGRKPDRSDVGELLPNKCNDRECTTITFVFVARRT